MKFRRGTCEIFYHWSYQSLNVHNLHDKILSDSMHSACGYCIQNFAQPNIIPPERPIVIYITPMTRNTHPSINHIPKSRSIAAVLTMRYPLAGKDIRYSQTSISIHL
jgi:hypothetical protein